MPHLQTKEVSAECLESMFNKYDIWSKIKNGHLKSETLPSVPAKAFDDATSVIIKHFDTNGKHIATTHCIRDCKGSILHWDAKDLLVNGTKLWRAKKS